MVEKEKRIFQKEMGGAAGLSLYKLINPIPDRNPGSQRPPAIHKERSPVGFLLSALTINSPKKRVNTGETATSSANPQVTRSGAKPMNEPGRGKHTDKWDRCVQDVSKKGSADNAYAVCTAQLGPSLEKKQKQSAHGEMKFLGRFRELAAQPDPNSGQVGKRFRVTLLQEGLGNFHDAFYYTPEAIQSAAKLYEGKKAYIDHPSETEEVDRPERSVKDILGYFENVVASTDDTGRTCLLGDLVVLQDTSLDRYRALMAESISFSAKHPDEELVGLSINASGDFQSVPTDQFFKEADIPDSCKPKLLEAMQRGITVIRPVTEMKSAISCDLVTTAGAGGEINQLLEGEKQMEKKEYEKKEAEKKKESEEHHEEDGGLDHGAGQEPGAHGAKPAHDDGDGDADGQTGDHPDAEQDEELIKKMLSKYLGDGFSDGDKQMMGEMYQHAMEATGGDEKAAQDMAGHSMKMAKHLQTKESKMAQSDAGGYGDGKGLDAKGANPVNSGKVPPKDVHIESARGDTTVKLAAEVAALRQKIEAYELKDAVEKGLRESKLPMAATKKFRETCLKNVKTVKEFQEKLSVFKEAYSLGGEAESGSFILGAEKNGMTSGEGGFSAADCVET